MGGRGRSSPAAVVAGIASHATPVELVAALDTYSSVQFLRVQHFLLQGGRKARAWEGIVILTRHV